jgi:hypothetical protein
MTVHDQAIESASARPGPGFCDVLQAGSQDIWIATLQHPFLAEVEKGTLPDEKLLVVGGWPDVSSRRSSQGPSSASFITGGRARCGEGRAYG